MKCWTCIIAALLLSVNVYAQVSSQREAFESFRRQARMQYEDFRQRANAEYAEFLRKTWKQYHGEEPVAPPKDNPLPPIEYDFEKQNKQGEGKPVLDNPLPFTVVKPRLDVKPQPQPQPLQPIQVSPAPFENRIDVSFYGEEHALRFDNTSQFRLISCSEDNISDAWTTFSNGKYDALLADCLRLRDDREWCDWAYYQFLKAVAESISGTDTNEAVLLQAYLFCQSGYQMRLGRCNNQLVMLIGTKHTIYNIVSYTLDGMKFYPMNFKGRELRLCSSAFPKEKPMSLTISRPQQFGSSPVPMVSREATRYPEMKVSVSVDANLLDFFSTYPSSQLGEDLMTRWALYANTPLDSEVSRQLYPTLKKQLSGKNQLEAAECLLNWVQTGFKYEYDDKVWGCDRVFFAEESLFFPYCDCEDRAILFSHLVRDLLELQTMLVYYPGHLATAVHFTEDVKGDCIQLPDGRKFTVC
ncbi:MAG: hypothetical protein Q4F69_12565, partial [Bacteroidia bacterium]|nr:hypothetical protein [Bacteroidia bacterium]